MNSTLLTIGEASRELRMSEATLRAWRLQGRYPSLFRAIGGRVLIHTSDLQKLISGELTFAKLPTPQQTSYEKPDSGFHHGVVTKIENLGMLEDKTYGGLKHKGAITIRVAQLGEDGKPLESEPSSTLLPAIRRRRTAVNHYE